MREVVLDTETTGLSPAEGHRIIEIGCIELVNHLPSGRQFHCLFNPEREVPLAATEIHGLKTEDLSGKPVFKDKVSELMDFIRDDLLVIHNAQFDVNFLNAELGRINFPPIDMKQTVDSLTLARTKFPGAPASLDALCKRFAIDNSSREKHSALLDADLLAQVYVELIGGRQANLGLVSSPEERRETVSKKSPKRHWPLHTPTPEELKQHNNLLLKLKDPIWTS